ncbi:MAG: sugar phosphate isomerase/epimerase [Bacteroidales bacterium]|nr:sugar phosphate isomerase/epimerase [Bacteroidales bacterium]
MNDIKTGRPLGLHQITAMEAEPAELIEIAHAVGYREVCLFTHIPAIDSTTVEGSEPSFPLVTTTNKKEVMARLKDLDISVANIEFFSIYAGLDVENFRPGLELGQELNARCAVTHVLDPDFSRAVDSLARLAEMASEYSLDVGLEFMGVSPPCNSIARAVEYMRSVNRDNFGIAVDMLHMIRTGGTVSDLRAVPEKSIKYAQICDGKSLAVSADYMDEALNGRLMPGEGHFPIKEILKALPNHIPLDVEIPSLAKQKLGMTALQRAKTAFEMSQKLLNEK